MSSSPDLAILTEVRFETLNGDTLADKNVKIESELLDEALKNRGIFSTRVNWSRPDVDWSKFQHAIFRTTWDYFDRWPEFSSWLDVVKTQTSLINSSEIIRWNTDKHYIADLNQKGCSTIPTIYIPKGADANLRSMAKSLDCDECVVKPTVSGSGRDTYRLTQSAIASFEEKFNDLNKKKDYMLQPFLPKVIEEGETTLILFDGKFSHAIRKTPAKNEFRVQDEHGGEVHHHIATVDEIECAEQAFAACFETPVYGRVDMVRGFDNKPKIMELELVEPELWLRFDDGAADKFAAAIKKKIQNV